MKEKMKKFIAVLLTGVTVLSLFSGCGKEETVASIMDKDHVFKETSLDYVENWDDVSHFLAKGDFYYIIRNIWSYDEGTDENGEYWYTSSNEFEVTKCKTDGSDKVVYYLDNGSEDTSEIYYYYHAVDENGNMYSISNTWGEEIDENGNYMYYEYYHLNKHDGQGKLVWTVLLNDYYKSEDYFYINSLSVTPDGKVAVVTTEGLWIMEAADGSLISKDESFVDCTIYNMKDNVAIVSKYGDMGLEYYRYDFATKKFSDAYTLPGNTWNYSAYSSETYDLYLANNQGVYGYNLGDEEPFEIMNYIDSDLPANYVNNIIPVSDTEFIVSYYEITDYNSCYSKMTKVAPEEVVEKKVLTLACYYLENSIKKQVIDFNKTNDKYRIEVRDYSQYDSYEGDVYTSGSAQLNSDIIAGNVPDILIANGELNMNNYQNKGLLYDLNKFFDKDENIKREDYLENILDAFESNGKLYQLPICFFAYTVTGKTSDVGPDQGWTMDELTALYNSKPEGTQVFDTITRDNFLSYSMNLAGDQFINWDTGECHFDSDAFIKMLEFANNFPKEINWDEIYGEDYDWNAMAAQYRNGSTMLMHTYVGQMNQYSRLRQADFGEDITFVGFPSAEGNGSVIMANQTFCISAKSKYKDAAWEFISHFISKEYQSESVYDFPILRSCYDKLIEDAQSKPYWIDENGDKIEYDDSYWLGDVEIIIDPATDEDIEYMMNFIESLNHVYSHDEDLMNIIYEEAEAYFTGQKTAKDVAGSIQSRASIYVSEGM